MGKPQMYDWMDAEEYENDDPIDDSMELEGLLLEEELEADIITFD
jgi:hypothetical protein